MQSIKKLTKELAECLALCKTYFGVWDPSQRAHLSESVALILYKKCFNAMRIERNSIMIMIDTYGFDRHSYNLKFFLPCHFDQALRGLGRHLALSLLLPALSNPRSDRPIGRRSEPDHRIITSRTIECRAFLEIAGRKTHEAMNVMVFSE
jgi:hypothetical protein